MKRVISVIAALSLLISQGSLFVSAPTAQAAVSSWYKGASIFPGSTTDFASSNFQQSVQNLKATGANYVALVVPYYQTDLNSTDIHAGWNTPTDASLIAGIDYAKSIGLNVAIKVHIEDNNNDWRAYINPSDRNGWFNNYGAMLVHLGQIGQAHGVGLMTLGTELVDMSTTASNPGNTQQWITMIGKVRSVFSGKLTYDANNNNNTNDPFVNEKKYIGFWGSLDYVGLSSYYQLNSPDNSVASIEAQWDYWNKNDLMPFEQQVNKPLLITEVGYRSISNSRMDPWNAERQAGYDATEQANAYDALLSYWNDYPYMQGVFWWNWTTNPNAGGAGDTNFTPQNKPAQQVMTKWFTNPSTPGTPGTAPAFTASITSNPASPANNASAMISAAVTNTGGALSSGIVDIEIYNQANTRVFQQFYEGQQINANETRNYSTQWNTGTAGQYRVAIGVFSSGWASNYLWLNNAATITVGSTPPPNNPPPNNPPPGNPPPTGSVNTNIWWPSSGATVSGVQPFKANLDGFDVSQYSMYWQVDGGTLNQMGNSTTDYPHKESLVDVSGWHWQTSHKYLITFVSKDSSGKVISQKSETITVQ